MSTESATSRPEPTDFRTRVLDALRTDAAKYDARSCFTKNERFCLLSDSPEPGKGVELFLEFPDETGSDPGAASFPYTLFELSRDGRSLLAGSWQGAVSIDGTPLAIQGVWETVCLETSSAYAFCERSIELAGGRRLTRRIVLAYNEALLILVDALAPTARDRETSCLREYRASFPTSLHVAAKADAAAREVLLTLPLRQIPSQLVKREVKREWISEEESILEEIASATVETAREETMARVFPLGLPEWRADLSRGDFRVDDTSGTLELVATTRAASLVAPLVFDFNVRRATRPCSWRPLTVGERGACVDENSAVAQRLQLGAEQYVLYTSTSTEPKIRSVLSRNLISDFMFGKFLVSRGVVPILDVEIEQDV